MFNKKKKFIISIPGLPRDEVEKLQAELNNSKLEQHVWVFDKNVEIVKVDE